MASVRHNIKHPETDMNVMFAHSKAGMIHYIQCEWQTKLCDHLTMCAISERSCDEVPRSCISYFQSPQNASSDTAYSYHGLILP